LRELGSASALSAEPRDDRLQNGSCIDDVLAAASDDDRRGSRGRHQDYSRTGIRRDGLGERLESGLIALDDARKHAPAIYVGGLAPPGGRVERGELVGKRSHLQAKVTRLC
jgi:hypothetical protein